MTVTISSVSRLSFSAFVLLAVAACGDDSSTSDTPTDDGQSLVGVWEAKEASSQASVTGRYWFTADGTWGLIIKTEINGSTAKPCDDPDDPANGTKGYSTSGGTLTLQAQGETLTKQYAFVESGAALQIDPPITAVDTKLRTWRRVESASPASMTCNNALDL